VSRYVLREHETRRGRVTICYVGRLWQQLTAALTVLADRIMPWHYKSLDTQFSVRQRGSGIMAACGEEENNVGR
jgi:hypothetical protein